MNESIASQIEAIGGAIKAPQLAQLLGVTRNTIYEWANEGRIPHLRMGRSIRFDTARLAAWVRSREH